MYRAILWVSVVLCFIVVTFGAYVRLSDAGLGCPDWPGCYGHLTPEHAAEKIGEAVKAAPTGPVSMGKAWKEMIHRYLAGALGLLIALMMLLAWFGKAPKGIGKVLPTALSFIVIVQALFGKWTVTLLLKPAIVTGHLIGGMLVFALLVWQLSRVTGARLRAGVGNKLLAAIALIAVCVQIVLGGWVSTNYAALACTDFPLCHGQWKPTEMDFEHGFHVTRELGKTASGALLSKESLTAIHWMHRVGALIVTIIVGLIALLWMRNKQWRGVGIGVLSLLALQVCIGIANIFLSLPIALAVAHNAGAALLLAKLVSVNARARR